MRRVLRRSPPTARRYRYWLHKASEHGQEKRSVSHTRRYEVKGRLGFFERRRTVAFRVRGQAATRVRCQPSLWEGRSARALVDVPGRISSHSPSLSSPRVGWGRSVLQRTCGPGISGLGGRSGLLGHAVLCIAAPAGTRGPFLSGTDYSPLREVASSLPGYSPFIFPSLEAQRPSVRRLEER